MRVRSPQRASRSRMARPAIKLASVGIGWAPMKVLQRGRVRGGAAGPTSIPSGEQSEGRALTRASAIGKAALPIAMATNSEKSPSLTVLPSMRTHLPSQSSLRSSAAWILIAARVSWKARRAVCFTLFSDCRMMEYEFVISTRARPHSARWEDACPRSTLRGCLRPSPSFSSAFPPMRWRCAA